MKKITIVVLLAGLFSAFTTIKEYEDIAENVKELYGYTLKNKDFDPSDFNLWVITHSVAFDKTFIAETEKTVRPDFDLLLALFFTVRADVFRFGAPLAGSTAITDKVRARARNKDRALSLGSDTTFIELPSYRWS